MNAILTWTVGRLVEAAVVDIGNTIGTDVGLIIVSAGIPESMSSSKISSKEVAY